MTAHVDVVIVGAGPVGLMTANLLGRFGAAVLVVEVGERLIDYPRAVGIDDESLRTFQAAGLIDAVLPHIVSHQCQRVVNRRGRVLAELAPTAEEFGWPRKNGFVQPLIDAELLAGLDRYGRVEVRFGHRVAGWAEDGDGLEVAVEGPTGLSAVRASYIVGCDGGRSETRHRLGVSFEGQSSPTRWLVVDLRNDPLGHPNAYLGADPARPYASISIPHGIRRFEFMLLDHESDADAEDPGFVETLLRRHVPDPSAADVIRSRVYTHHSRIAGAFRAGRVLLAGDAAHLMPVWQGQGFNSGIRDAANLAWKLAAVVSGRADDRLLDTYDQERRAHALAMIRLSTLWGRFVSPTNRALAGLRDAFALGIGALPAAKAYVVGMKFKPMPRYTTGAVALSGDGRTDALVGRLLIQPRVATRERPDVLLDEVLGDWFSLVVWNNDPVALLDGDAHGRLAALGVHLVTARPHSQLCWAGADRPGVTVVGDRSGALNRLFDDQRASVLLVRPDRVVAGAVVAQQASTMIRAVCSAIGAVRPSADGPVRPAPASGSPFAART